MFDDILAQGIFGNTTIGIAVSDREGRITESNDAFCQFVGRDKTELLRMTVADLCIDADRERELAERGRLVAGQISHLSFRKRYPASSGKTAWGDTVLSAVRDAAGVCRPWWPWSSTSPTSAASSCSCRDRPMSLASSIETTRSKRSARPS